MKKCYYEVIGVQKDATDDEIKKQFRKQALKLHPDKNKDNAKEATENFQILQEAYEVLSDPKERLWYDEHKEQILSGADSSDIGPTKINLWQYFRSDCFSGFDDGPKGFYSVFRDVFELLCKEEMEWIESETAKFPDFGNSESPGSVISQFYSYWSNFSTRKAMAHADVFNPNEIPNRQLRRDVQAENNKMRKAARKQFNDNVKALVSWVKKRDPRVVAQQKAAREKALEQQRVQERKKIDMEKAKLKQKEVSRQRERERWQETQQAKQAAEAAGLAFVDNDPSSSDESDAEMHACEICGKTFKSLNQFESHVKSKKHQKAVAEFQKKERAAMAARARAASSDGDEETESEREPSDVPPSEEGKGPKQKRKGRSAPPPQDDGDGGGGGGQDPNTEDEDEDDDLDDDLYRQWINRRAQPVHLHHTSDSDSDEVATGSMGSDAEGSDRDAEEKGTRGSTNGHSNAEAQESAKPSDDPNCAESQGSNAYPPAPRPSQTAARCEVCGASFPSRTRLFQHINKEGHAAVKLVKEREEGKCRKKKKGGKNKS